MKNKCIIYNLFEYIFTDEINKLNITKCMNIQSAFIGFSSIIISILGFFISKCNWIVAIDLLIVLLCVIVYIGTNHISDIIDSQKINILTENERLIEEKKKIEENVKYIKTLYAETKLIASAVHTANKNNKVKELYTKFANSLAEMVSCCSKMKDKENFIVNVYAMDVKNKLANRVAVQSYVNTFIEPKLTIPRHINKTEMKGKYYVRALKSKQTYFVLKNNSEIKASLSFDGVDEKIISQYTQYVGMTYTIGEKVKLYIEIISFNKQKLDEENNLQLYVQQVIAPFSSLIANVNWDVLLR